MENNTNTNTNTNENKMQQIAETTILKVETLAKVVKKYASENEQFENVMICKYFAEFKQLKDDEKDEATKKALNKLFWSFFTPLEAAKIKLVTKVGNKVTKTGEANKAVLNAILQPYETQKKKVRNMLAATLNKGQFELHFAKKAYLQEFDKLTENEFCQLYKGANLIQIKNVLSYLSGRLIEAEKATKKSAK